MNWKELNKESLESLKDKSLEILILEKGGRSSLVIFSPNHYEYCPDECEWEHYDGDYCCTSQEILEFYTHYCILIRASE